MKQGDMHEVLMTAFLQWPHVVVTETMSKLWWMAFKDTDKETFWKGMLAVLKTSNSNFPPTIGQINQMMEALKQAPSDLLTEGEAWALLITAVKRFGNYQQKEALEWLESRSERVKRCAEIMQWQEICMWQTDDEPANRAHFWRVYQGLENRDSKADLLGIPRRDILGELEPKSRRNLPETAGSTALALVGGMKK